MFKLTTVADYEDLVGGEIVSAASQRSSRRRKRLFDYYGGGVAEILSSLTLLMNASGVRTG